MDRLNNWKVVKEKRRKLRQSQTPTEELLWTELRNNRLVYKFKRQHSIGLYILDFYCPCQNLAIELDGVVHQSLRNQIHDRDRSAYLYSWGIKVIRFKNEEVSHNLPSVLARILAELEEH